MFEYTWDLCLLLVFLIWGSSISYRS